MLVLQGWPERNKKNKMILTLALGHYCEVVVRSLSYAAFTENKIHRTPFDPP